MVLTENAISQIVAVSRQERAPATGPFTPAPSQWAGENGSTGPIEIQGPRRQDMAVLLQTPCRDKLGIMPGGTPAGAGCRPPWSRLVCHS